MPADPKPPAHLSAPTRRFWRAVLADWELTQAELRVLQTACEAWDRLQGARAVLDREGVSYVDRFGAPRMRPEVAVERDSRVAFLRAIRQLGLEDAATAHDRRYAANKRRARAHEETRIRDRTRTREERGT